MLCGDGGFVVEFFVWVFFALFVWVFVVVVCFVGKCVLCVCFVVVFYWFVVLLFLLYLNTVLHIISMFVRNRKLFHQIAGNVQIEHYLPQLEQEGENKKCPGPYWTIDLVNCGPLKRSL